MKAATQLHLAVGAGAGLGAALRYATTAAVVATTAPALVATAIVNVVGSLLIGVFAGLTGPRGRWQIPPPVRAFVMAGFCGGLTTFSAMSLETLELLHGGEAPVAMMYLAGVVAASLAAVWAGDRLAARLK